MTTQATTSSVGNARMSRLFTATSTDGSYTNQTESITSSSLGLSMPNQTIDYVCSNYAAGLGVWRIISSQTNVIKRQGFMSLTGYTDYASCKIASYNIQSDDLFQVYTLAVDATSNQTNVLGLITSNKGVEAFVKTDVVDSTSTEIKSVISDLGVGDLLFGSTIQNVRIQAEDGAYLSNITFTDAAGGTVFTGFGNRRQPTDGGLSLLMNGAFPVAMTVQKGWTLKVKVSTA